MNDASSILAEDVQPSRWEGPQCAIAKPDARLVQDADAWRALWNEAFGPKAEAPSVDFERHFAVAVFAGTRRTGGYSVEFLPPRTESGKIVIPYRIRVPSPTDFVIQAFTSPYAIQLYRRTGDPVEVRRVDGT